MDVKVLSITKFTERMHPEKLTQCGDCKKFVANEKLIARHINNPCKERFLSVE